jgi:hypothetical protein
MALMKWLVCAAMFFACGCQEREEDPDLDRMALFDDQDEEDFGDFAIDGRDLLGDVEPQENIPEEPDASLR